MTSLLKLFRLLSLVFDSEKLRNILEIMIHTMQYTNIFIFFGQIKNLNFICHIICFQTYLKTFSSLHSLEREIKNLINSVRTQQRYMFKILRRRKINLHFKFQ